MSSSKMCFERWSSREYTTWPHQVFQKYNAELSRMLISHILAHKYSYHNLGKVAKWEDPLSAHMPIENSRHLHTFKSVRSWSKSFNDFDNWINLNTVMAMSSNLETYMSTAIKLALESDVGVLFGASKRIDGIEIIKHGGAHPFDFEDKLMSCTKGDWSSRISAFERIFGKAPEILKNNISDLERLRKLRNNVGHSFGRDIQASREHNVIDIQDMERLNRNSAMEYQSLIYGVSRAIDRQLLIGHIGEHQTLFFYHNLRPELNHHETDYNYRLGVNVWRLKKALGQFGAQKAGKKFCKELIEYYEGI